MFSYQWVASNGTTDTKHRGCDGFDLRPRCCRRRQDHQSPCVPLRMTRGNEETLTSTATNTVTYEIKQQISNSPAAGVPTINGTAQVGEKLTADTSSIADDDGLTKVSYQYQWILNDGSFGRGHHECDGCHLYAGGRRRG